jgi:diaminopimelate decarboxylase
MSTIPNTIIKKEFPFSDKQLYNLSQLYSTPFYLYDADSIENNCIQFLKTFRKYFPGFRNFFAVKALPNPSILDIIHSTGMDFDVSSPTEYELLHKMNIHPSRIMYTSNFTSSDDMYLPFKDGAILNLDDIDGLDNLERILDEPISTLCFRLNPNCGKTDSETQSNILGGFNSKFGMSHNTIIQAYTKAKKIGVKNFGLHCMTGSNILDINYWVVLLECIYPTIRELFDNGIQINFLNIGGGIGIPYREHEKQIDLELLAKTIFETIQRLNDTFGISYQFDLFMECGRYITGPYGWLVTRCESIKETNDKIFYGVNASMANLMRPGMYGAYHALTTVRAKGSDNCSNDIVTANVVGTLCENNDWFVRNRLMKRINKYDYVIFHDAGAHAHCMGFNYNGKLRSPEIMSYHNKFSLIRKGETFEYLYQNCIFNNNVFMTNNKYFLLIFYIVLCFIIVEVLIYFNIFE